MAFLLGDTARIDNVEVRNCMRKVRHATWREAYAHQESLIHRYGADPQRPLRIYRCRQCGDWHVGSRRLG